MKILVDENLPHKIRQALPEHELVTIAFLGWSGIENGDLLRIAAQHGFAALLTTDRGMEYEQNLDSLPLSVVVLIAKSNTMEAMQPLMDDLRAVLNRLKPRTFVKIEHSSGD